MPETEPHRPTHLGRNLGLAVAVAVVAYVLYKVGVLLVGHPPLLYREILEAATLGIVGYLVARAFTIAIHANLLPGRAGRHAAGIGLFFQALVGVGVLFGILVIFGVSLDSVFLGGTFLAIVLGLASQTVLGNIFAGFVIVLSRPFDIGERVSFVSPSYAVVSPSYPHEMLYAEYSGVVTDIQLMYSILRTDDGRVARIPNSAALGSLVLDMGTRDPHQVRIRCTLPLTTPVEPVQAVVAGLARDLPPPRPDLPAPRFEVADVGKETWDAVVVLWTRERTEDGIRDRVLRPILALALPPPAAPAPSAGPPAGAVGDATARPAPKS